MATSLALTCQYEPCGKPFEAARKRKYCETLCERRAYTARRKADGRLAEQRRRLSDYNAAYQRENADRWKVERECLVCGATWKTMRRDAKYCSSECRDLMRPGTKESPVPASHPARQGPACAVPARHPARCIDLRERRWVMGSCRWCAERFTVLDNRRDAAYCSARCVRAAAKAARRARERDAYVAYVSPAMVHARDGWRCQLCGGAVERDAVVPHPRAPVVDHVVSLANGGTHEPSNVQCAHFMCNSIKGHRDDTDVPALMVAA